MQFNNIKMMRLIFFSVIFSLTLFGQEISDLNKSKFWKALTEVKTAELALERANTKLQTIIKDLNAICKITADSEGNPVCAKKEDEKIEKKKE